MTSRSVITSASEATVSVFDTIAHTASQTTKLVNTIGVSVDMLDTFVSDARKRQLARSKVSNAEFYKELHEETAKNIAARQRALQQELEIDPQFKELYTEAYTELKSIIEELQS